MQKIFVYVQNRVWGPCLKSKSMLDFLISYLPSKYYFAHYLSLCLSVYVSVAVAVSLYLNGFLVYLKATQFAQASQICVRVTYADLKLRFSLFILEISFWLKDLFFNSLKIFSCLYFNHGWWWRLRVSFVLPSSSFSTLDLTQTGFGISYYQVKIK